MEIITNYIDEVLDHFPINKVTQKMRTDLIESTRVDYNALLENGQTEEDASTTIINRISGPEQIAPMVPNKHNTTYVIYWLIAIAITIGVFSYVSNPDFLQLFLPARMEFPDIIEKFILYIFVTAYAYAIFYSFYRLLPQKLLNRTTIQSAAFLYAGTIMAALYFSVAMAFVWYTFNGFNVNSITFDLTSKFIYAFYKLFFSSNIMVMLYAVVNGALLVLSNSAIHIDLKAQPYELQNIYQQMFETPEPKQSVTETKELTTESEESTTNSEETIKSENPTTDSEEEITNNEETKKEDYVSSTTETEEVISEQTND